MGRERNSGFTLIELMIVVSIVLILGVIAIPSFEKYIFDAKEAEGTSMLLHAFRDQQRVKNDCEADRYDCKGGWYAEALEAADSREPALMYRPAGEPSFNLITGSSVPDPKNKYSLSALNYHVATTVNADFGFYKVDGDGSVDRRRFLIGAEAQLNGRTHLLGIDENGTLHRICDAWTGDSGPGADLYRSYTNKQPLCGKANYGPQNRGAESSGL